MINEGQRRTAISRFPVHSALIAGTFVINTATDAAVYSLSATRALVVAVLVATLATLVLAAALRDRHAGGLLALTVVIVFVVKIPVLQALNLVVAAPTWLQTLFVIVVPLALIGLLVAAARIISRNGITNRVTGGLNAFAIVMLGVVVTRAIFSGAAGQALSDFTQPRHSSSSAISARTSAPDIYVLLLDGYARADTLQQVMGFDNRDFLAALTSRGFHVSAASESNYTFTEMTLASMFQMQYLDEVPGLRSALSGAASSQPAIRNAINSGASLNVLRSHGYKIVATATGTAGYVSLRAADEYLDRGRLNEFEFQLLRSTWLLDLLGVFSPDLLAAQHRALIDDSLTAISSTAEARRSGPQFVFTHVLAPHAPHVFRADGSPAAVPPNAEFYNDVAAEHLLSPTDWADGYIAELQYINGRVIDAIDGIDASDSDAVIIVMSDHGSAAVWNPSDPMSDPSERFTNLFAARTPGHPDLFGDTPTPVNVFRILFNSYLDTNDSPKPARFFLGLDEEISNPVSGGKAQP